MRAQVADGLRRSERHQRRARLEEIDRETQRVNFALCIVGALFALGLAPVYGLAFGAIGSVPALSWMVGLAYGRDRLGIWCWTIVNLIVVGATIVALVGLTGGADSPTLALLGVLGVFVVFYFPTHRLSVAVTPAVVVAIVGFEIARGGSVDEPAIAAVALLIALVSPLTTVRMVQLEMTHRRRAVIDPLTGCLNRHAFDDRTGVLTAQMQVTGDPIGVVVFDIDHFKAVNDDHGHGVGDAVLSELAYQVRKQLRSYEHFYRTGGEEFVVLLPGADADMSMRIAERLRMFVEDLVIEGVDITISCGVAIASDPEVAIADVLVEADLALYAAKRAGRNRSRVCAPASQDADVPAAVGSP